MQNLTKQKTEITVRLPCRGCTQKCSDYARCEGKPWRLDLLDKLSAKRPELTVFYDGNCPLCMAEMNQLMQLNHESRLKLVNLHDDDFDLRYPNINRSKAYDILHGQLATGEIILGLDVTCKAWSLVGKHKWLKLIRLPVIRFFADLTYLLFARYRNQVSSLLTGKPSCNSCTPEKCSAKNH